MFKLLKTVFIKRLSFLYIKESKYEKKSDQGTSNDEVMINKSRYALIHTTYEEKRKLLKNIIVLDLEIQITIRVLSARLEREKKRNKGTSGYLERIEKLEEDIEFLEILSGGIKEKKEFREKHLKDKTFVIIDGWVERVL